jgi:hypothetical protein
LEYEFEPGLIGEPQQYDVNGLTPPGTLSAADKQWALKWYPPLQASSTTLEPFQAVVPRESSSRWRSARSHRAMALAAARSGRAAASGPDRLRVPVAYAVLFSFIRSGARVVDCRLP